MKQPKKVVIIATDTPKLEQYCSNWHGMKKGLERLNIPYEFVTCRPTLNIDKVVEANADLIVYGLKDIILNQNWRTEIKERCPDAKIVLWYGDYRDEGIGQEFADCSEMDAMFVSNDAQEKFYKSRWKMKEVYFLPLGCEPKEKPVHDERFNLDFVFIGGQLSGAKFKDRARYIQKSRENANLKVINSFNDITRTKIFKAMHSIYSTAKVSLDMSHFTDVKSYTSNRFWIIPAYHGLALTKRFPGCTDFYPENTRVYFDTFEEMVEKVNYYTTNEEARKQMIEAGHKHSYNHTYDKRWQSMFKLLF